MEKEVESNVEKAEACLDAYTLRYDQELCASTRGIGFALLAIVERLDKIESVLQDLTRGGLA